MAASSGTARMPVRRQPNTAGAIALGPERDEDAARAFAQEFAALRNAWNEAHGRATAAEVELDAAWERHFAHGAPAPDAKRIQYAIDLRAEAIRRGHVAASYVRSRPI
jgi:hypothetical protein